MTYNGNENAENDKYTGFCTTNGLTTENVFPSPKKQEQVQIKNVKCTLPAETQAMLLGGMRSFKCLTDENFENKELLNKLKPLYPAENFYFYGSCGRGKTHLAVCLLRPILPNAKLTHIQDISRNFRKCEDAFEEEKLIKNYVDRNYCFDDFGTEKITDFLLSIIYEIIDKRWQTMKGGLIITSNYSLSELSARSSDRVASRIFDLCGRNNIIKLEGKDHRIK